jgi:hypothetical protein
VIIAHGVGSRGDLPIPLALAWQGGAIAVIASFVAVALLWQEPKLQGGRAGRPIPMSLQRILDATLFRVLVRLVTMFVAVVVVVAGLIGPTSQIDNVAPWVFYVTFWVGLLLVSILLGPVWRVLNPLRLVHLAIAKASGGEPDEGIRPLPPRLGYWPAAVSLATFLWLELVYPDRAEPHIVSTFIALYAAAHIIGASIYGMHWFDKGDGFEVYSSFIGRLSIFGRRDDGRLVLRNPLDGIAGVQIAPGFVAVVAVLIGSTAFDGISRTTWWTIHVAPDDIRIGTAALAGCIFGIALAYVGASRACARYGEVPAKEFPGEFASSLIPIAAGYGVAHYFSLFVLDGQRAISTLSDPFGTGANFLGTAGWKVNYTLILPKKIGLVQVAAIVIGHILGVLTAHDRAARLLPEGSRQVGQFPMIVLMVGLTILGILLLFGT